ncbi:4Fe-4S binding protein [Desulfatibacillum aliphaticivorans]|uniref:4Fe-4S binding protein n=1 Tax=Desulfatibacillum aliphaticivorans TaxID=218208 RepID=UPI000409A32D|nr:4Fe-4S binding protein [Desulfatibacillum aliphaticivorans]
MGKFLISIDAASCTGCMKCGLACSELYHRAFNPLLARIQVIVKGEEAEISFTQECTECGVCVDQCFYGALSKTPRES